MKKKCNFRFSSTSCAIIPTGLRATHVALGGNVVPMGITLVTPATGATNTMQFCKGRRGVMEPFLLFWSADRASVTLLDQVS